MTTSATCRIVVSLFLWAASYPAYAASAVHKCVTDGKVTFQSSPCTAEATPRRPTVDELNAERRKRQAAISAPAASEVRAAPTAAEPSTRAQAFRCDGRKHCSQMRSCSEAKYFLANCPGVKMDGNNDGVPCEQQWCTHPFAK
jgi:hypothetical protein